MKSAVDFSLTVVERKGGVWVSAAWRCVSLSPLLYSPRPPAKHVVLLAMHSGQLSAPAS